MSRQHTPIISVLNKCLPSRRQSFFLLLLFVLLGVATALPTSSWCFINIFFVYQFPFLFCFLSFYLLLLLLHPAFITFLLVAIQIFSLVISFVFSSAFCLSTYYFFSFTPLSSRFFLWLYKYALDYELFSSFISSFFITSPPAFFFLHYELFSSTCRLSIHDFSFALLFLVYRLRTDQMFLL